MSDNVKAAAELKIYAEPVKCGDYESLDKVVRWALPLWDETPADEQWWTRIGFAWNDREQMWEYCQNGSAGAELRRHYGEWTIRSWGGDGDDEAQITKPILSRSDFAKCVLIVGLTLTEPARTP